MLGNLKRRRTPQQKNYRVYCRRCGFSVDFSDESETDALITGFSEHSARWKYSNVQCTEPRLVAVRVIL